MELPNYPLLGAAQFLNCNLISSVLWHFLWFSLSLGHEAITIAMANIFSCSQTGSTLGLSESLSVNFPRGIFFHSLTFSVYSYSVDRETVNQFPLGTITAVGNPGDRTSIRFQVHFLCVPPELYAESGKRKRAFFFQKAVRTEFWELR